MMDQIFMQQLESVPESEDDGAAFVVLERQAEAGAKCRFGRKCRFGGVGKRVKDRLAHEFELIRATNTAKLFLYWADIVKAIGHKTYPYVRSAHNCSLVSYCLGITEVNPLFTGSNFERLLTRYERRVPILHIEVSNGRGAEAREYLEEDEASFVAIEENAALPDLHPKEITDFFKTATFEDREILQSAAVSLGIAEQKPPKTIKELADLLVYKRYAGSAAEKPSVLYQEDVVDLLVRAGLSYEEAECARRALGKRNRVAIDFYRDVFVQTARKNGYSSGEANAVFSAVEEKVGSTVCRASFVAMAQYLYMDTFLQDKTKG